MKLFNMIGTAILFAGIANSEELPTVTVHYANQAALSSTVLKRALDEAGWIFSKSGIKIEWVKSNGESMPSDPTHIKLTFVGTDPRPGAPSEAAMGFAYVKEERANRAVMIFQNIQAFAARNPSAGELYLLTGAAIAHELGHLVFHSTHHSEGVMSAKWTKAELQRINKRALRFSKDQSEQLQTGLLARR